MWGSGALVSKQTDGEFRAFAPKLHVSTVVGGQRAPSDGGSGSETVPWGPRYGLSDIFKNTLDVDYKAKLFGLECWCHCNAWSECVVSHNCVDYVDR